MKKRIAIIGFRHEAMLACPFLTDPSTTTWNEGAEILDLPVDMIAGIVDRIREETEFEPVPLLFARALPGGAIERSFYERIKSESLRLLGEQGPFDGIVVVNHGAAEVDGLDVHGDTDYVVAIRKLVGDQVPIAVPFDMHGQVTPELLDAVTVLSCLRTAPHRDYYETSRRATDQLIGVIKEGLSPRKAAVHVPMFVPGEKAMTAFSPAKELFGGLADYDRRPGVLEAHIFIGFGWNDRPWCGMKTVVVTEDDEALALKTARELADAVWAERHRFQLRMEVAGVREGLIRASEAEGRTIYLSDSGDNTTAGAGGDLTFVLQEALALDLKDIVVAGIFAPDAVAACRAAGVGAEIRLEIGRHISAAPKPAEVTAIVEALGDRLDTTRHHDHRGSAGAWCRARIRDVIATFHAARVGITGPGHLQAMGIDPRAHKIYVVKVGYMHPQLEDVMSRHICLISEGIADLDLARLPFARIARPSFPMDPDMEWSSEQGVFSNNRHLLAL